MFVDCFGAYKIGLMFEKYDCNATIGGDFGCRYVSDYRRWEVEDKMSPFTGGGCDGASLGALDGGVGCGGVDVDGVCLEIK